VHFHCYTWMGIGDDRSVEDERRPNSHAADPDWFLDSALPPMRTCDWLLKAERRIDASPATVEEALDWLATHYRTAQPSFLRPADEERIGLEFRLENARESLTHGVDVQWGFWLQAGRFTTCAVVCCSPNRHARYPCPLRRG
jgi:hypothetical protein